MDARDMNPDWRAMFDRDFVGSWDLAGRDVTVTIKSAKAEQLNVQGGRKSKKPVLHFVEAEKGLALNKTNAKVIAAMYGNDTREWVGKRITLYPTTTQFGDQRVDCIRIRPKIPAEPKPRTPEEAA